jgi:hypothetical protein
MGSGTLELSENELRGLGFIHEDYIAKLIEEGYYEPTDDPFTGKEMTPENGYKGVIMGVGFNPWNSAKWRPYYYHIVRDEYPYSQNVTIQEVLEYFGMLDDYVLEDE